MTASWLGDYCGEALRRRVRQAFLSGRAPRTAYPGYRNELEMDRIVHRMLSPSGTLAFELCALQYHATCGTHLAGGIITAAEADRCGLVMRWACDEGIACIDADGRSFTLQAGLPRFAPAPGSEGHVDLLLLAKETPEEADRMMRREIGTRKRLGARIDEDVRERLSYILDRADDGAPFGLGMHALGYHLFRTLGEARSYLREDMVGMPAWKLFAVFREFEIISERFELYPIRRRPEIIDEPSIVGLVL